MSIEVTCLKSLELQLEAATALGHEHGRFDRPWLALVENQPLRPLTGAGSPKFPWPRR